MPVPRLWNAGGEVKPCSECTTVVHCKVLQLPRSQGSCPRGLGHRGRRAATPSGGTTCSQTFLLPSNWRGWLGPPPKHSHLEQWPGRGMHVLSCWDLGSGISPWGSLPGSAGCYLLSPTRLAEVLSAELLPECPLHACGILPNPDTPCTAPRQPWGRSSPGTSGSGSAHSSHRVRKWPPAVDCAPGRPPPWHRIAGEPHRRGHCGWSTMRPPPCSHMPPPAGISLSFSHSSLSTGVPPTACQHPPFSQVLSGSCWQAVACTCHPLPDRNTWTSALSRRANGTSQRWGGWGGWVTGYWWGKQAWGCWSRGYKKSVWETSGMMMLRRRKVAGAVGWTPAAQLADSWGGSRLASACLGEKTPKDKWGHAGARNRDPTTTRPNNCNRGHSYSLKSAVSFLSS